MNFGSFDMFSQPLTMQSGAFTELLTAEKVMHASGISGSGAVTSAKKASIPKCIDKSKTLLPSDFQPSNYTIICGNKRKYFNSVGNCRLRVLVKSFTPQFSQAQGKLEKGIIVSKVMNIIKEACPMGAFVTLEKGQWWQVSERTSREKVGSYFRDCLASKYKSSAQNKIARRKSKREEKRQTLMPDTVASYPQSQIPYLLSSNTSSSNDDDSSIGSIGSGTSASFYDVDDLSPTPFLEL